MVRAEIRFLACIRSVWLQKWHSLLLSGEIRVALAGTFVGVNQCCSQNVCDGLLSQLAQLALFMKCVMIQLSRKETMFIEQLLYSDPISGALKLMDHILWRGQW